MESIALGVIGAVAAVNVVTFAAFGLDKWKASRGRKRVPESTLLLLAWGTGLVGAWLAMSALRHKTRKVSFRVWMWIASVLNLNWLLLYAWYRASH